MCYEKTEAGNQIKTPCKTSKVAILQHNSAHPRTAKRTAETVHDLGFEVMEHPPDSPDLR
jgi:hypothetical protein